MDVLDGTARGRMVSAGATFLHGRRSDEDRDRDDGNGSRRRNNKRGGGRKRLWNSFRGQTQCRDTSCRDPEPSRHRRHGSGPATGEGSAAQGAQGLALDSRPNPAPAGSMQSPPPAMPREPVYISPLLEEVRGESADQSREPANIQASDDEMSDARGKNDKSDL